MISIKDLSYQYPKGKSISFRDVEIPDNERWLLLGESGSGKTTLLHLLGGLLRSQHGGISVDTTEITQLSESALDRFRGKHYGFVFQKNHLISALTVKNNLLMAPFLSGMKQDEARVTEVLSQLQLADQKDKYIKELSHGQAQRVAIARAVLNKPTYILADEPTSALDDKNCEHVINLLFDVAAQNKSTLIVATHDQRLKERFTKKIQL